MKNARRQMTTAEVVCNKRRRDKDQRLEAPPSKKTLLRPTKGVINWQPDDLPEESCKKLREIMGREYTKKEKDRAKIKGMMERTFSFRRTLINSQAAVSKTTEDYPCLLLLEELEHEFYRLVGKDNMACLY